LCAAGIVAERIVEQKFRVRQRHGGQCGEGEETPNWNRCAEANGTAARVPGVAHMFLRVGIGWRFLSVNIFSGDD
jgi:hypothetical protein